MSEVWAVPQPSDDVMRVVDRRGKTWSRDQGTWSRDDAPTHFHGWVQVVAEHGPLGRYVEPERLVDPSETIEIATERLSEYSLRHILGKFAGVQWGEKFPDRVCREAKELREYLMAAVVTD